MKVAPGGGTPLEIGTVANNLRGASWGRDDVIVFATVAVETGLSRISAAGGEPDVLTRPDGAAGEVDHLWPVLMPDGKHVVFTINRRTTGTLLARDLAVLDMATRKWRVIREGGSYPRYVATGHLLFATDRGVHAAPFDPVACEFRGEAVRVIEDVSYKTTSGAADFDVSDAGTLAFISGSSASLRTLAWVDRTGTLTPIPAPPHTYDDVDVSPDGTRAILTFSDGGAPSLQVYDFARGSLTPILPPAHTGMYPVWSPNGRDVYYRGAANGISGIYRVSAAGASLPELILEAKAGGFITPTGITPDRESLLITIELPAGRQIHLLNLDGAPSPKRLVADPASSINGRVSPNGQWLLYAVLSGGTGSSGDVFMRPFPNVSGDRAQVSVAGGANPVWASDSRAIYYVGPDRVVWRVDVGSSGQLGTPVRLLTGDGPLNQQLDFVTGAGRIIRVRPIETTGKANELRVVLNWFELLKQEMAGAR